MVTIRVHLPVIAKIRRGIRFTEHQIHARQSRNILPNKTLREASKARM